MVLVEFVKKKSYNWRFSRIWVPQTIDFVPIVFPLINGPLQVLKMEIATISEAYVPLTFYGKDTSMYVQSYIYLYLFIFIYTYFIHICIVFIHRLYICVYIHIYIHRYGYTRVTWITNKTS